MSTSQNKSMAAHNLNTKSTRCANEAPLTNRKQFLNATAIV